MIQEIKSNQKKTLKFHFKWLVAKDVENLQEYPSKNFFFSLLIQKQFG